MTRKTNNGGVRNVFNKLISLYLERRYRQIEYFMENPIEVQERVFRELIAKGLETSYGREHDFELVNNQNDYSEKVPLVNYDDLKPYIDQMMRGKKSVLWPGEINWYSKSSGTTSDKSKFIPISQQNLKSGHIKGSWDVVTLLYQNEPDSKVFAEKNLVMGGALSTFDPYPETIYGDISAIMLENMPAIGRPFYTPDFETALLHNWDEKIEKMVKICSKESVTMFGGVPTWTIVLFRKILEYTGKSNILEVWPNVQTYVHGGVSFSPYREQFKRFLPSEDFNYVEVYNASEGYFAIQNDLKKDDMLLLLDNGNYYEFIPMDVYGTKNEKAIPLSEVEIGVNYALVISTTSGLWRYQPGDTLIFTSTLPYKIKISGRTKHFINVFGEELMVSNTDKALAMACREFGAEVSDYTVAPIFIEGEEGKGGHEWAIEFTRRPNDIQQFARKLDLNLQKVNSDYEAKRYKDMALLPLKLNDVSKGTFLRWMKYRGRLGGQNKVLRLSNERKHLEQLLTFS